MKRLWKILNATRLGSDLACWAADSRGGAVVLLALWSGSHVALGLGAIAMLLRKPHAELLWPEIVTGVCALMLLDTLLILRLAHVGRTKRA